LKIEGENHLLLKLSIISIITNAVIVPLSLGFCEMQKEKESRGDWGEIN
jgi:energy-converting hydrogenase Eha subunit A